MTAANQSRKNCEAGLAERLGNAFNGIPLGIIIVDETHKVVLCNARYVEMFGAAPQTFDPAIGAALDHRADGRIIAHTICQMPCGGGTVTFEDVTEREKLSSLVGKLCGLEKEQDERLRVRNMQFDAAINNMSQGLCFFDGARRLIVCNDRYAEMYSLPRDRVFPGVTLEEIVDMRFEAGSVPAMSREEYLVWRNNVAVSAKATDSIVELRDGRTFQIRHRPMPGGGWVATHDDITDKRQSEAQIAHMARHDGLTDLANRLLLNERLEHALKRLSRDEMVAIHHLDLDKFKAVNDTLGHPVGDKLLRQVADRLRSVVRESDTIARMGGDEFVLVQVAINGAADAAVLAQRLIDSLSQPYDIDGHHAVIGASIGIAIGPTDGGKADDLLRNADLALYRAKAEGRGTFRFFEPDMNMQMQSRRMMEQDMRKALPAGEFELYYQPVVNLAHNSISGFEALIRWNHPGKGSVSPNAFIPLAEEIGFIVPLGEWIIKQACATAARWPEEIGVAVNVSAVQFRHPGLVQVVVNALATSGLDPTRLEIEITESVLLHDKQATLDILHQLRSLGVRIAMDDFGTGYSSLTYLQSFPFDRIKIDRSFVNDITNNVGSLNIVRAITALASGMGMAATAEGVETQEQLESIQAEGCTDVQGFLFSRPLPLKDIEKQFVLTRDEKRAPVRIAAA